MAKPVLDQDMQITATPSGGTPSYAITWYGAVQYLSATDIANPVFNAGIPGTFKLWVNVTDINANQANDSVTVVVSFKSFRTDHIG